MRKFIIALVVLTGCKDGTHYVKGEPPAEDDGSSEPVELEEMPTCEEIVADIREACFWEWEQTVPPTPMECDSECRGYLQSCASDMLPLRADPFCQSDDEECEAEYYELVEDAEAVTVDDPDCLAGLQDCEPCS